LPTAICTDRKLAATSAAADQGITRSKQ